MVLCHNLTPELEREAVRIEAAARAVGLDFFEVLFESLSAEDVNAVAAYGGFARRYGSWRFGMDFERLQKGYAYGFSKIYELVINGDPTHAYLVRSNSRMEQKLVMAHVFGHADFFRHNLWFEPTDRGMEKRMEAHADRVGHWMARLGRDRVERFLDRVLALDTLLDPYLPQRRRWGQAAGRLTICSGSWRAGPRSKNGRSRSAASCAAKPTTFCRNVRPRS
ncbi:MAG: SpoVR family protein [Planctomycetota bacterium]